MRTKSQNINTLRKRFPNEWLLVAVDKIDPATTIPLTGRVLAHNPSREIISRESFKHKGLSTIIYTGKPPRDVAFIF